MDRKRHRTTLQQDQSWKTAVVSNTIYHQASLWIRFTMLFRALRRAPRLKLDRALAQHPVGTALPFSDNNGVDRVLLYRSVDGINKIDVSEHPEEYFHQSIDLNVLGNILQERMALFATQLEKFTREYIVQQLPSSDFTMPLVKGDIYSRHIMLTANLLRFMDSGCRLQHSLLWSTTDF